MKDLKAPKPKRYVVKNTKGLYLANRPGFASKTWRPRSEAVVYTGGGGKLIAESHARCYDGKVTRLVRRKAKLKKAAA